MSVLASRADGVRSSDISCRYPFCDSSRLNQYLLNTFFSQQHVAVLCFVRSCKYMFKADAKGFLSFQNLNSFGYHKTIINKQGYNDEILVCRI